MFISNVGEFGVGEMVGYYSHSDSYRSMMGVGYGKVTKINQFRSEVLLPFKEYYNKAEFLAGKILFGIGGVVQR